MHFYVKKVVSQALLLNKTFFPQYQSLGISTELAAIGIHKSSHINHRSQSTDLSSAPRSAAA